MFPVFFDMQEHTYIGRVTVLFHRLVEQGLIEHFNKRNLQNLGVKENERMHTQRVNVSSIVLANFELILYIFLLGELAGLIVFLIEVTIGNWYFLCCLRFQFCAFIRVKLCIFQVCLNSFLSIFKA